jgi:hypothetical protein
MDTFHEAKGLCSSKTEVVKVLDLAAVSVFSKGLNCAHTPDPKSIREVVSVMEKQYNISQLDRRSTTRNLSHEKTFQAPKNKLSVLRMMQ